jgi:hypothetical protein
MPVQAADAVTEEHFTPGRTTLVLIGIALVLALLSALTAAGIATVGKVTVFGFDVTFKKDTPTTTMSFMLAAAAVVAVFVSIARVGVELAAFKARVTRERQGKRCTDAQNRADAAGGVIEPEGVEDQPTDTPVVPAGRVAVFRILPALAVGAGILVMIVAIA